MAREIIYKAMLQRYEAEVADDGTTLFVIISGHGEDYYNGVYWQT